MPPIFNGTGSRISGGLGCAGCHRAPEFDIDPNSLNIGIIGKISGNGIGITNTRTVSLRDLLNLDETPNSPMMHTGFFTNLKTVIEHYGTITIAPGTAI